MQPQSRFSVMRLAFYPEFMGTLASSHDLNIKNQANEVLKGRNLVYSGIALSFFATLGIAFSSHIVFRGIVAISVACLAGGIKKIHDKVPYLMMAYLSSPYANPHANKYLN